MIVCAGLPSNIRVARFKLNEMAEIHCEYALNTENSKFWYKKTCDNRSQWVAHSSGNIGTDYRSRIMVINEEQKKRMTVKFLKLEIWDSGTYQCKESVSKAILTEILLIITMDDGKLNSMLVKCIYANGFMPIFIYVIFGVFSKETLTSTKSSKQNAKTWSRMLPVNSGTPYRYIVYINCGQHYIHLF